MNSDLKNIIGSNIRSFRKKKHHETVTSLSKIIGVSQPTVSDWETGKKMPRADNIKKIANHWQISTSQLLTNYQKLNNLDKLIADHIDDNFTTKEINDILNYIDLIKRAH
ncbi:helix-turn-helix transcriptional regulator [Lactobacillus mellis]|nr:helix-turn-helix transcriptional regulator [Bombilactobacillus mellis]